MAAPQNPTAQARTGRRVAAGSNPIAVAIAPGGRFLYVANWGANDIAGYRIDPVTGALAPIERSPFTSGRWPHSIAIAPAGGFLFTANGKSNDVSAFRIDAQSGALTPVAGSPIAAGDHPEAVTVSPCGTFAYVCNGFAGTISGYRVDPAAGALRELPGSPFPNRLLKLSGLVATSSARARIELDIGFTGPER